MSNVPVPAPSKAAIRALRGLVFGTTCTLALVTEDRRLRINAARSAVRNADKLKSAKRYHAGGTALAVALEGEVFAQPAVVDSKRLDGAAVWKPQRARLTEKSPQTSGRE